MSFCFQCTIDAVGPPLVGLVGVLCGAALAYFPAQAKLKQDLDLRYKFAMFDRRMEAAQDCYVWAKRLSSFYFVPQGQEEKYRKKTEVLKGAKAWYDSHCLYLTPVVRSKFVEVIKQVSNYETTHQNAIHKATVSGESQKSIDAEQELEAAFKSIKDELTGLLESEVDGSLWSKIR